MFDLAHSRPCFASPCHSALAPSTFENATPCCWHYVSCSLRGSSLGAYGEHVRSTLASGRKHSINNTFHGETRRNAFGKNGKCYAKPSTFHHLTVRCNFSEQEESQTVRQNPQPIIPKRPNHSFVEPLKVCYLPLPSPWLRSEVRPLRLPAHGGSEPRRHHEQGEQHPRGPRGRREGGCLLCFALQVREGLMGCQRVSTVLHGAL